MIPYIVTEVFSVDSITAPLAAIGLDGLCKGYLSDFDSTEVTGKLVAGSTVGSCTHWSNMADPSDRCKWISREELRITAARANSAVSRLEDVSDQKT